MTIQEMVLEEMMQAAERQAEEADAYRGPWLLDEVTADDAVAVTAQGRRTR